MMNLDINRSNVIRLFFAVVYCILATGYCQVTIENCPTDQTLDKHRAYWEPPTATSVGGAVTLTASHTPGSIFPDGPTTVTYSAQDENGNTDGCIFQIIINNGDAPIVQDCPSTVEATADLGEDVATANWTEPIATAVNGDNLTWSYRNHAPGDDFNVGSTAVFYEFVDSEDNAALCEFTVEISATVDTVGPMVDCPDDISVEIAEGETETTVTWVEPTPSGDYATFTSTHEIGDSFGIGQTAVAYIVEDDAGNHDDCEFQITVSEIVPDETAPTFTYCPDDVDVIVGPNVDTYTVTWDTPTANDTVSATSDIVITSNVDPPYAFQVETSTEVIYTATDEAGNDGTCTFMVTVSRDGVPTFQNCPTNLQIEMTGVTTPVNWDEPDVSDDSTVTSNYEPGDSFTGPAEYTVTYTAIDPFSSTATCSFTIEIQDTTPPTVQGCPNDIVRTVTNKNTATVSWVEPTAEDNSGEVTIDSDISPGSTFTTGQELTVTYTATDTNGLQSTCEFTVTVSGTTVCGDNPCENGGVCVTEGEDSFECVCIDDYNGETCSSKGLSTLQIIAIGLGSLAGLLILLLLLFCCCYYCCFAVDGEEERPTEVIIHKAHPQHIHTGVAILPESKTGPVYDNRPLGARFHNSLPRSSKRKSGRRFRHKSFGRSKAKREAKDATTGNYGRHHDYS